MRFRLTTLRNEQINEKTVPIYCNNLFLSWTIPVTVQMQ